MLGYVIVLCQTLLLSILNGAVSFLWGLYFQFFVVFLSGLFPCPIFLGKKKSLHMGVSNVDEGYMWGREEG